ncbi:dipeptidase [Aestuariimicrobium sp. T2.26MG-19.2B]|uniref:dipeptidase n=1 Tax=Aestuariimicrobium sp. T2.26MG-19.2B TaxID=3040679 RepID=UPI00247780CA|nr:dipeptidase [Aestuariimicrobium sp. T2.26MG-19.2B]CAI9405740.1 Succinyl-diaminopimelate desuccinylase [Aestuariimicrobium sp. T2.26MG-19.2B]
MAFDDAELRARVEAVLPATLDSLKEHCAIASVSSLPDHADQVDRSAAWVVAQLEALGCPDVRIVSEDGGKPAVIAHFPAPAGQPTVCLYAHHDVQPTGDESLWTSEPFVATERTDAVGETRLFGRGTSDDKGGLAVHLAALRAYEGQPPVGVTLFIEGEEEIGSPSLATIIERHHEALAADVFVIADSGNWQVGVPAFTTTLRGLADCVVEVETLDHALHSGSFGGVVPDALTTLCRLLATLHDDRGRVAVADLGSTDAPDLDYPEDRLRSETGLLDGVDWIGDGSVVSRLWAQPSVSVLAIDAPSVANASNTLQPKARAKVSLRVAPGDDAHRATQALRAHLESHAPFGAHVTVRDGDAGQPGLIPFEGAVAEAATDAFREAWGVDPVQVGQGGSIPMVADFQRQFPRADVLVTAVGDPDSRAHGIDESLHLGDWRKACLAETLLLARLAR